MSKRKNIALWVVTVVLSLFFLFAGTGKLLGSQEVVDNFRRWGYPDWFRIVTGDIEILGGLLLLVRRFSWVAAGLLTGTMLGALATHIHASEWKMLPLPAVPLLLLVVVGWARRPRKDAAT